MHVVVGAAYCIVAYALGAKKASFERVGAAAGVVEVDCDCSCCCWGGGRLMVCCACFAAGVVQVVGCCSCVAAFSLGANNALLEWVFAGAWRWWESCCLLLWLASQPLPTTPPPTLQRLFTKDELEEIAVPASMHAIGHLTSGYLSCSPPTANCSPSPRMSWRRSRALLPCTPSATWPPTCPLRRWPSR